MSSAEPKTRASEESPGVRSARRVALLYCLGTAILIAFVTMGIGVLKGQLDPTIANAAQGFVWAFLLAAFGKAATITAEAILQHSDRG